MNSSGAARLCRVRLQSLGSRPDAASLAEIVWLALQLSLRSTAEELEPNNASDQLAVGKFAGSDDRTVPLPLGQPPPNTSPSAGRSVDLFPSHRTDEIGTAPASFVNVPGGEPLPGRQRLERALKPFKRRLPSRHRRELDLVATAEVSAERRAITPIYRPAPERWFDVALLAEASDAMHIWDADLIELRRMLSRHGAFRGVRLWRYSVKQDTLLLACATGGSAAAAASPRVLVDREGRRLCLFLTTGTSTLWRQAAVSDLIASVGRRGPVAVVQLMPHRTWPYTLLGAADEEVLACSPGTAVARLGVRDPLADEVRPASDAWTVPMTSLEPSRLAAWSNFVMTKRRAWHPAIRLAFADAGSAGDASPHTSRATDASPCERIAAFREIASPEAFQLLRLLSGMPLTLPVMRLMQVGMANRSLVQLAEVLLSGLLERVTPQGIELPPDQVEYDFAPGIRTELLDSLSMQEGSRIDESLAAMTRQAERFIEDHGEGGEGSFVALVHDVAGRQRILDSARSFLSVVHGFHGRHAVEPSASQPVTPAVAPMRSRTFRLLSEHEIRKHVLRTQPLLQGSSELRCLLFFATIRQQSWLVASDHAVAFVLDDADTQHDDRLVQRVDGWLDALPVKAELKHESSLLRMGGPNTRAWYCSAHRFASQASLEDAVTALAPGAKEGTLSRLRQLALDYEGLRQRQRPGSARTAAMTRVVNSMLKLPTLGHQDLTLATRSKSFGNQLVAVATLQRRFDPTHEEWLFGRITGPQAFVAFHAAVALQRAVPALGPSERQRVHERTVATQRSLLDANLDDVGVVHVLDAIEKGTRALKALGDVKMVAHDLAGAKMAYEEALTTYRQFGDRMGEADTLSALVALKMRTAEHDGARQASEEALAIYRQLDNRLGEANALMALGNLQTRIDDLAGGRAAYEMALTIYQQLDSRAGQASALSALGDLMIRVRDWASAIQVRKEALVIYQQLGDAQGEANAMRELGELNTSLREVESDELPHAKTRRFKYDLFVSYAHIDDEPMIHDKEGWVSGVVQTLSVSLAQMLGRDISIWRDNRMPASLSPSHEMEHTLESSAVLVAIISPAYLRSEWACREFQYFCGVADGKLRIVKIVKLPVEPEDERSVLPEGSNMTSLHLFTQGPPAGKSKSLDPHDFEDAEKFAMVRSLSPYDEDDELQYFDAIYNLARTIASMLTRLGADPKISVTR